MPEGQTITSLRAIRRRVVEGAALVRCDGSEIELEAYLAGSLDLGWNVRSEVQRGDILIDTVGTGQDRRIVAVTPVADCRGGIAEWDEGEDVPLPPGVFWTAVEGSNPGGAWPHRRGTAAVAFVDSLISSLQSRPTISVAEGRKAATLCRRRSKALRKRAIEQQQGRCEACGVQPRAIFGPRGDRAIDVHHVVPLSTSGETFNSLDDVRVLCASCHRLVHTESPPLLVTVIRPQALRMRREWLRQ